METSVQRKFSAATILRKIITSSMADWSDDIYWQCIDDLLALPQDEVVPAILEGVATCPLEKLNTMLLVVKDLRHMSTLPRQVLNHLAIYALNSAPFFALLYLYSSLQATGYRLVKDFDAVVIETGANLDQYHSFINDTMTAMKEILGPQLKAAGDTASTRMLDGLNLIESIEPLEGDTKFVEGTEVFRAAPPRHPIDRLLGNIRSCIYKHGTICAIF